MSEPLVGPRVTVRRPLLGTNLASIMVGFAMYAMSLSVAGGDRLRPGQSVLAAGLALSPGGLVMMALAPVSARYGARTSLPAGVGHRRRRRRRECR
ncbi:hypothetical protein [Streptomyces sp. enrichment culture]|uniref:hypothetical protein n=1 Tax=Streptomyces sp. enrichment culture TaxID=1795815 RepID=UPI003F54C32C